MGVGRKNPPRTRPANVPKRAGEGGVSEAITDLQVAVRRLEGRPEPEEAEPFVLEILPLPPAVAAVQIDPTGALSSNEEANPIQDLYVVNLHTSGVGDTFVSQFVQKAAELNAILTGAPINFTNGRGVGSGVGACSFFSIAPDVRRGNRILAVSGTFLAGLGAGTSSINFKRRNANGLAPTSLGSASSGSSGAPLTVTISGLSEVVAAGVSYVLEVNCGRSQDSLETITVEYDRPPP